MANCDTYTFSSTQWPIAVFNNRGTLPGKFISALGFTYYDSSVINCDCNVPGNIISGTPLFSNLSAPIYETTIITINTVNLSNTVSDLLKIKYFCGEY
jgi:hypothetical protein